MAKNTKPDEQVTDEVQPDEYPVVLDFMDYRALFRASLVVNFSLAIVLCISLAISIYLNAKVDNPWGNGIREEVRAIDSLGMPHELNLHPQDPKRSGQ